jgi:hypothetical protein
MTVAEIEQRLVVIRAMADPGGPTAAAVAHEAERGLWRDVLTAIAERRCEDPAACAAACLQSEAIDFIRWFE